MQDFKSPGQAQRFLAAYGPSAQYFRPRRHLLPAPEYRQERGNRFQTWQDIMSLPTGASERRSRQSCTCILVGHVNSHEWTAPWGWVATGLCPSPWWSSSIWLTLPKYRDSGRAGDCMNVTLSSSGCRNTSSPCLMPSGRSSRNKMPWCASDPSPGMGICPPPIKPTSEMVRCGVRHGYAVRGGFAQVVAWQEACDDGHTIRRRTDEKAFVGSALAYARTTASLPARPSIPRANSGQDDRWLTTRGLVPRGRFSVPC
jgi:hypothetical protein